MWYIYFNKVSGWIQLVFPAFIKDSHAPFPFGIFVRDHAINLMDLQGSRVLGVVDAHSKTCLFMVLVQVTPAFEFLPAYPMSLMPVDFSSPDSATSQTNHSNSFQFSPATVTILPS